MEITEYQEFCGTTHAPRPTVESMLDLGLSYVGAEAGEALNLLNKMRHQFHPLDDEMRSKLKKELGDVMWGIAVSCNALGITITDLMDGNYDKLSTRYSKGEFSVEQSIARVDVAPVVIYHGGTEPPAPKEGDVWVGRSDLARTQITFDGTEAAITAAVWNVVDTHPNELAEAMARLEDAGLRQPHLFDEGAE